VNYSGLGWNIGRGNANPAMEKQCPKMRCERSLARDVTKNVCAQFQLVLRLLFVRAMLLFIVGRMTKSSKNSRKGRSRRQNKNGKKGKQGGVNPDAFERRIVYREIQMSSSLVEAKSATFAAGYIPWSGVTGVQEFKELSDLYAQCRIVSVRLRFAPMGFHANTGSTYNALVGCVAHDPTSQSGGVSATAYQDLVMMPSHKLFMASGQGDLRWQSLMYKAPLTKSEDFGNTAETFAPGQWASSLYYSNVAGNTYFIAQNQNGAVNTAVTSEVMQVILQFGMEFRQPIEDRGNASSRKTTQVMMSTFRNGSVEEVGLVPQSLMRVVRNPLLVDDEKDYVAVAPEKKEQPPLVRGKSPVRQGFTLKG